MEFVGFVVCFNMILLYFVFKIQMELNEKLKEEILFLDKLLVWQEKIIQTLEKMTDGTRVD